MRIILGGWVVPISSPPIRGGAIAIDRDEIVAVGPGPEILARFGEQAREAVSRAENGGSNAAESDRRAQASDDSPAVPRHPRSLPIGQGALAQADGGIVALRDAVLLPSLVNAHTHLELSWMRREATPRGDFMTWLRAMIHRRVAPAEEIEREVCLAIAEMVASGTALIGDVGNTSASLAPLARSGLRGRFFLELIGGRKGRPALTIDQAEDRLREALGSLAGPSDGTDDSGFSPATCEEGPSHAPTAGSQAAPSPQAPLSASLGGAPSVPFSSSGARDCALPDATGSSFARWIPSIVPHAPHTVPRDLLAQIADRARRRGDIVSVHVAESAAEDEMLRRGTGPFRVLGEELGALGPDWKPPHLSPAELLDLAGLLGPSTLAVHGVHLSPDDMRLLARRGTTVVLCPRSNAWLGVGKAPVASLLAAGVRIALGTDSYASNESLDVLAEVAALRRLVPGVPPETLVRAATLGGAEALGNSSHFGSLEPGKKASLIMVRRRSADRHDDRVDDPFFPVVEGETGRSLRTTGDGEPYETIFTTRGAVPVTIS